MSTRVTYRPKDVLVTMAPLALVSIAFVVFALNIIPSGHVLVKGLAVLGGSLGAAGSLGLCFTAITDLRRL